MPPDQPANSRHLHDRGYFDPVHSADSVRAGADNHPLLRPASDGSEMLKLVDWAQAVVTFHGGASAHLDGVAWIYRVHPVLGMTIFLIFPSPASVHVWSAPVEYFTRRCRWYAPGAERWRRLPFILTGSGRGLRAKFGYLSYGSSFMPGGGCRLTRPTGSSHGLKPRRPAQAQPPGKISTRYL